MRPDFSNPKNVWHERRHYPDDPWAHCQAGNALRFGGRLDEAEALLAAAIVRFPDHRHIAVAHARAARSENTGGRRAPPAMLV